VDEEEDSGTVKARKVMNYKGVSLQGESAEKIQESQGSTGSGGRLEA